MFFPYHDDNPTWRTPWVTIALIALNAASFLYMQRLPEGDRAMIHAQRGFVPARIRQLRDGGIVVVRIGEQDVPIGRVRGGLLVQRQPFNRELQPDPREIYTSLVTAMFLHGGWMHLIGNMWFLWLFGNNVEDRLGHALYAALYFVGGLLAWAAHWAVMPDATVPVIGASGAVAAVLGAYAVRFPHARVHCLIFIIIFVTTIELPAYVVLGIWFLGQVIDGVTDLQHFSGGVAFWAHVGGFVAGAILMVLMSRLVTTSPEEREQMRHAW